MAKVTVAKQLTTDVKSVLDILHLLSMFVSHRRCPFKSALPIFLLKL